MSKLHVKNLFHSYDSGKSWAVNDISLEIKSTGVVGILGSNGAGKSTSMNIICGVINQTKGTVEINSIDIRKNPEEAKRQIGFLPQEPPLYLDLTVYEYLNHCGKLRLIEKNKLKSAIDEAMEKVKVTHFRDRILKNLSGGYRQRVGIAQAIIHKPQLVILDEPTVGLDPNQIIEVRNLVSEIANDRAVLFSTHILSEVDQMCKDVIMIEGGKVIFNDSLSEFRKVEIPNAIILSTNCPVTEEELLMIEGVKSVSIINNNKIRLSVENIDGITDKIILTAIEKKWSLNEVYFEQKSLDAVFSRLSMQHLNH